MKSKYVIKYDKILKNIKIWKIFKKKYGKSWKYQKIYQKNRKIEKSMKIKKLIKKRRG